MELSVIILNYKVPYYLLQCIESVQKSIRGLDAEIIVVDNHSQDESCALVKANFPAVKVIENSINHGFSKGNNIGVARAQGHMICLLNPDTIVGETTFGTLLKFIEDKPDFGLIGPQLINGRGEFLPESKRNVPTPKIALKKLLNHSKSYYSSIGSDKIGQVDILVGAFMLMRKDRYLEVGQLDEDYFMYGEDIDLSYKFLKAGYINYYYGDESVLHFKGESTAKDKTYRKRFYGAMKIFYQKHFQDSSLTGRFVDLGLRLGKTAHSLKGNTPLPAIKIDRYIVVGATPALQKSLESVFEKPFEPLSTKALIDQKVSYSFIVFNAAEIDYNAIIIHLKTLTSQGNIFRFKPERSAFIIGSDSTTDRGQITFLPKKKLD